MYTQSMVNVRSLPDTAGNKVGGLAVNDPVEVTGKCKETGWYRIIYAGTTAYVSGKYLAEEKVPVQQSETVGNLVWVPTNGGTKYHNRSSCSKMKDPIQVSVDTAVANGYEPCKRCY